MGPHISVLITYWRIMWIQLNYPLNIGDIVHIISGTHMGQSGIVANTPGYVWWGTFHYSYRIRSRRRHGYVHYYVHPTRIQEYVDNI